MNYQIYKPNSKNTGCAFNFSIDTRNNKANFYVNAIQQFGWNEKTKNGSFVGNKDNPEKKVSIKLNEYELGEIVSTIETRIPWSGYHDFNDNKTSISFVPWDKVRKISTKDKGYVEHIAPAFGFSIIRNGNQIFRVSLEPGEVQVLKHMILKFFDLRLQSSSNVTKQFDAPNNTDSSTREQSSSEDSDFDF